MDESSFCLIPYIPYAWQEINQKIEIKSQQSKRYSTLVKAVEEILKNFGTEYTINFV